MKIHRQVVFGPFVYADREAFGVRLSMVFVFSRLILKWRSR